MHQNGIQVSSIKPYNSQTSKKQEVEDMFDNIAGRYDLLNHLLSWNIDKGWRSRMVKMIEPSNRSLICDMATGTADVAIMLAKTYPDSKIVGMDLSQNMLDIGQQKIIQAGLNHQIHLQKGDSEGLIFDTNYFNALTIAFGVRNFEDLSKGLQEMTRVVKPNGQVLILEFSKPRGFIFKNIYKIYFKYILTALGKSLSKDHRAYDYLYESVQAFPDDQEMIQLLKDSGLRTVKQTRLMMGICTIYNCMK